MQRHEASGKLRTEAEIRAEIADREATMQRLKEEMRYLQSTSDLWKAKMASVNTHTTVIAVLRWTLGEDLLWE